MRYQVGDVVKIREDLHDEGERGRFSGTVGYDRDMARYAGMEVTITRILTDSYKIKEDENRFFWSEDMIDGYIEKEEEEEITMEVEHNAINLINKQDVIAKGYETLNICDIYHPTDEGMNTLYDEWAEQKGEKETWNGHSVLDILSKHPNYVPEKGYIVKRAEYDRPVDFEVALNVINNIRCHGVLLREEIEIKPFTLKEIVSILSDLSSVIRAMECFRYSKEVTYKGQTFDYLEDERLRFMELKNKIIDNMDYYIYDNNVYSIESEEIRAEFDRILQRVENWLFNKSNSLEENEQSLLVELVIDDTLADYLTKHNIKGIRSGQKFNKVVGKILTAFNFQSKWPDYNRQMARLGDAVSPMKYTRFTIISANFVDFWRMSFGSSWKSCHTIDKEGNYRPSNGGDGFEGMHASGTESYMLDASSVVMYTVDKDYNGNDFEMQPKINRCMFHIGEGKFIMGRVYPQGTDGEKEVYKQWRTIFQTIMSECMGVPNYWKTEYDHSNKLMNITTRGTHYPDYEMPYCNIAGWSWNKPFADSVPSEKKIIIGAKPICPCCGNKHTVDNNIECEECLSDDRYESCYQCDDRINLDNDNYYTDIYGERVFCCLSCANAAGYHLPEDTSDGYVYSTSDLYYDDWNGLYYYYNDDAVKIGDEWYHNEEAAREAGYEEWEDEWYSTEDFEYDAFTGEYFPYHSDPSNFFEHDGNYFVYEESMNEFIANNAA